MMTEKEFNHTILPLAPAVWTFISHLSGDKETASDVTQEVMLRLWKDRRKLEQVIQPKAYTLKIARNLCLDILKKQKPLYNEEDVCHFPEASADPLREIETQDTAAVLRQLIDLLPPAQKEVILLREIEELEYSEISHITGLEINHIRVLVSRARTRLRELILTQGI